MRRLLILLPLLLVACGSKSDADQIKDAYTSSAHAAAKGDAKGFCALYTDASQKELAKALSAKDCETAFKQNFHNAKAKDIKALQNVKVTKVVVKGDTAQVTTTLDPQNPEKAVKQDGQWKIQLPGATSG